MLLFFPCIFLRTSRFLLRLLVFILYRIKFLSIFSFLTYYGAFIILFSIFDCSDSSLFMWLIAVVPHSGIPYVQIGFIIILYIFNLFSMLNLEFRLVNRYICLLFIRILSIIDLVCCFHVSCVSK